MNVQELIASVRGIGGELALHGERIIYRLPHTPEAPQLVEELRAHREEIKAVLLERGKLSCDSPDCASCYDVGEGKRIHSPRPSKEWLEWKAKWEREGRIQ